MLWRVSTPARARRTPPAGFVVPCAPTILGRPPKGPGWLHEIKHDGYRIIARKDGEQVRLWTRQRNECSSRFRQIAAAVAALPVQTCTLDAEAVVFRPDGHCDFHGLRSSAGAARASLVCFDLLELDSEDLRRLPIEARRAKLAALLGRCPLHSPLIFSESFDQDGATVFDHACAMGLEGIVSKRRGTIYRSGPSADWVKTLNPAYARLISAPRTSDRR